jgi:hypothetical protein
MTAAVPDLLDEPPGPEADLPIPLAPKKIKRAFVESLKDAAGAVREARRMGLVVLDYERPRTRGACEGAGVQRPCVFVGCRYHLGVEPTSSGGLRVSHPNRPFGALGADKSCALDVADRGPATLEEIGEMLGVTRERTRQIEEMAFDHIRQVAPDLAELLLGLVEPGENG